MTTFHPDLVPEPEPEIPDVLARGITDDALLNAVYKTTYICILTPILMSIVVGLSGESIWVLSYLAVGAGGLSVAWRARKKEQRQAIMPHFITLMCALDAIWFIVNGATATPWVSLRFPILAMLLIYGYGKRDQQLNLVVILAIQWLGTTMLLLWGAML